MKLNLNDTFNRELPADPVTTNSVRQVSNAAFSYVTPKNPGAPKLVHASPQMLAAVGLTEADANSEEFFKVFSGAAVYPDTKPYAMNYAGHQFGNWAGQLGDGRAINLFEVNHDGQQWALQLKGAGKTPYSRGADGLAVLRSSVREYLCSEAMFHLGVPTTRALSLVLTGDDVLRDMFYNGNAAYEKGAIVCRVAPSFVRFGNFQIFLYRQEIENLKKLADYTITNFFPHLGEPSKEVYIEFFREVCERTLRSDDRMGARRFRPRRDEHGQYVDFRFDDRLRSVRLARKLRSELDAEHDRRRTKTLSLRQSSRRSASGT